MSIVRTERKGDFTVIPNELINDADLDGDALGLLVFLLSKPADWWVKVESLSGIKRFGAHGKVVKTLQTLRTLGYATLTRMSTGHTEWVITDTRSQSQQNRHIPKNGIGECEPHSEKPHLAFPHLAFRNVLQKKDLDKELNQTKKPTLPFQMVRDALVQFAGVADRSDAKSFHDGVMLAMAGAGWVFEPEAPVDDRGDGKHGRVDIHVTSPCEIWIELDREQARQKSITKLRCVDGYRVVMLRDSCNDSVEHGIDAVIGCGKRQSRFDPLTVELPSIIPRDTWQAFCQHRREIRKPITQQACNMLLKRLLEMAASGHDVAAILETSIANGWQSVHEPKGKPVFVAPTVSRQARRVYQ